MAPFMLTLICFSVCAANDDSFSDIRIEAPFKDYLSAHPLLMETTGSKVIKLPDGTRLVLSIASVPLKGRSAKQRLDAEKVCRINALRYFIGTTKGVQVASVQRKEDQVLVVIEDGKKKTTSIAKYMEWTEAKIQGIANDMPVVGRWKSKEGDVFYQAIGVVCDKNGKPIR